MSGDSLTRYRAKRDFTRTPEPAGKTRGPGKALSFVVQRHAARRLHYDLRLEWHGVMKSWAVTRGPSMDPADKRLAVEVEDHPLDYASFEGTIPKPSYGGGTVQVWDRGEWAPLDPATVDADLDRGELKFVLSGERLNGRFVLVRMRPRHGETETHHNWLLIKERDSAATPGAGDAVLKAATSVLSGRTMEEIAAGDAPGPAETGDGDRIETNAAEKKTTRPASPKTAKQPAATRKALKQPATTPKAAKQPATKRKTKASAKQSVAPRSAVPLLARKPRAATAASPKPLSERSTSRPASAAAARRPATPRPAATPLETGTSTQPAAHPSAPARDNRTAARPPAAGAARGKPDPERSAMPRFIAPQLCKLRDTPPTGPSWVHELKLDGYRLQLRVEAGTPVIHTRTGLDWTDRFPSIAKAAATLPDCLLDGEAVALDAKGHPSFSALQATLAGEQDAQIVYYVFDLLHDGTRDFLNKPLQTRKQRLREIVPQHDPVLRYLDHFAGPGEAVLASACELSMEGIVSKRLDARYGSGRGDSWTKAKCRGRDEFLVGGWTKDKKARGLGALLVGARRNGNLVYLGRVGTGFSARLAEDLLRRLAPLKAAESPFIGKQPVRTSDVAWVRPDLVVEVAYGGWTEADGLLRHASFQGIREDKPAAEVTPPERPAMNRALAANPAEEPDPAPGRVSARPSPTRPRAPGANEITITHPDRVLWPETAETPAVTKADLAAYYALYADRLLAQIAGRPLSIIRAPDGISSPLFFQRQAMRGQSPLIGTVKIAGQAQPYLRVDDAAGLAALAQISVVELHPWGARADTPDNPDRLVFDFDPAEGLAFDAVITAALDLRERLKALGLDSFARVTGGKGLHVVVPLRVPRRGETLGWTEAKQFARLVCMMMQRDAPDRYTTTMAKKSRGGKIFLDYLRNDRTSTAIAAWSPRGRPGAPVARPLAWSAVKPGLNPAGWNLPGLLNEKLPPDPWADFEAAGGDLRAAIARATRA